MKDSKNQIGLRSRSITEARDRVLCMKAPNQSKASSTSSAASSISSPTSSAASSSHPGKATSAAEASTTQLNIAKGFLTGFIKLSFLLFLRIREKPWDSSTQVSQQQK